MTLDTLYLVYECYLHNTTFEQRLEQVRIACGIEE